MNLASCKGCGVVVDLGKVNFIPMEDPDNPDDEKLREKDGTFDYDVETHYSDNVVYDRSEGFLETWQCPVCKEFNGKGEE